MIKLSYTFIVLKLYIIEKEIKFFVNEKLFPVDGSVDGHISIFNRSLCSTKRAYNRGLVCDYGDTAATETVY